eukprot:TRINITY_DN2684_c0_g1_i3.p1 TRINITY_DN2684_c0_g1~~TRINITY_DN2684_c0_g1_i3.p1  ORF type:complete len:357 (+),score=80.59 TRINITY_DN2684_c0_g1_i3:603-1673(+)
MIMDGCGEQEATTTDSSCEPPDAWKSWLCAISACIIISCIGIVGIILLPISSKRNTSCKKTFMACMISFAAGALAGDAILHLIPEILGLHDHSDSGEEDAHAGHSHGDMDEELSYVGPLSVVFGGIIFFFLVEKALYLVLRGHTHSHGMDDDDCSSDEDEDVEMNENVSGEIIVKVPWYKKTFKQHLASEIKRAKNAEAFGWLNLIADSVHNFLDGVAIGSSFASSLYLGLVTTLAVVFHEIPQELGDFSILLKAGFSKKGALFFNFCTACTCLLGVFIGTGVGHSSEDANKWILSWTAGGFLYIALVDMLPELQSSSKVKIPNVLAEAFALFFGFVCMFWMVPIEEKLLSSGECN